MFSFITGNKYFGLEQARVIEKTLSKTLSFASKSPFFSKNFVENSDVDLEGYRLSEIRAWQAAEAVAQLLHPGMTENHVSKLLVSYLQDSGVQSYFHAPFVWFGKRTAFQGVKNYKEYQPGDNRLRENDPFILDVAPIVNGFVSDIAYAGWVGQPTEGQLKMKNCLDRLYREIPLFFASSETASEIMDCVEKVVTESELQVIHEDYPFSVLGHRVIKASENVSSLNILNFGWQAYAGFLKSGGTAQLFNRDYRGTLQGLWAIEPHLSDGTFGSKFEFIYLHSETYSGWLKDYAPQSSLSAVRT